MKRQSQDTEENIIQKAGVAAARSPESESTISRILERRDRLEGRRIGGRSLGKHSDPEPLGGRKGSLILILAFIVGLFLLIYPSGADYWNSIHRHKAIMDYAKQVASMSRDEYTAQIRAAEEYNRRLAETKVQWNLTEEEMAEYEKQLSFNSSGNMGYIDIPKINVKLPIYHGVSDDVLKNSIGHLPETSLPVGGEGTHCALSGHRGLPSAKLLSELDKVEVRDTFTLSILNETYTYEVDQIRVVVPTNLSDLKMVPGHDYCTLVTCTPYGVNTHRLLVRGHRVENIHGDAPVTADAMQLEPAFVAPFIMMPCVVMLVLGLFIITSLPK